MRKSAGIIRVPTNKIIKKDFKKHVMPVEAVLKLFSVMRYSHSSVISVQKHC